MFAGDEVRNYVIEHLNSPGNVINLQSDTQDAFDKLFWSIEAINRPDAKIGSISKVRITMLIFCRQNIFSAQSQPRVNHLY